MRWLASELLSHQRARVRVDYTGRGVNPVDGATGVPYARRSVDGILFLPARQCLSSQPRCRSEHPLAQERAPLRLFRRPLLSSS